MDETPQGPYPVPLCSVVAFRRLPFGRDGHLSDDELIDAATHLERHDDQRMIDLERWRRDRATAKEQAEDARNIGVSAFAFSLSFTFFAAAIALVIASTTNPGGLGSQLQLLAALAGLAGGFIQVLGLGILRRVEHRNEAEVRWHFFEARPWWKFWDWVQLKIE